jgi:voltage-gated potassium channel
MKQSNSGIKLLTSLLLFFAVLWVLSLVESVNPGSNIKSFSDALWYSMVTLTTVGYGDFYPVTPLGKMLALVLIIGSLGVLGYIIGKATEFISEIRWREKMGHYGTSFENHVIIIGWDSFAHAIVRDLAQANQKVAIITDQKDDIDLIYTEFSTNNVFCLFSDLNNISMFDKASMVFVNMKNDTEKLISILNIKKEFPKCRFIVALNNSDLADTFYSGGAAFVLSKNEIASKLMASYIFEPDVADMTNDLLTIAQNSEEYDIKEFKIVEQNKYAGKTYGEIFTDLKTKLNVLPIGLAKIMVGGKRNLMKLPKDDVKVEVGDYIILIMSGKESEEILKLFGITEGVCY